MKRAIKQRFYPTEEQAQLLAKTFGCARVVYNHILHWRSEQYRLAKIKIGYAQASEKLTKMKKLTDFVWLNEVSCVPWQQVLRHQQKAFSNFFSGRAKYPTFKKKHAKQSIELTKSAFTLKDGDIYIAKSKEPLNIRWSRKLTSSPSTITISKDAAGRYFVSMLCEFSPLHFPIVKNTIGIDLGITSLFVTDKGEKFDNPKFTRKYERQLALAQRRLSKKKLGSSNRNKARHKVARIHAKISDCRLDNLHKLSRKLVNENQVICVETLKVKNMVRNRKLSKHIADASWGELLRQLEYKSDWSGRDLVKIDPFFPSSKKCSTPRCGYMNDSMALDVRDWHCPKCNTHHDRDINAAINIKAVGQAVLAFGENVNLV